MDFFERHLGIDWDRGDGSLEVFFLLILGIIISIIAASRVRIT